MISQLLLRNRKSINTISLNQHRTIEQKQEKNELKIKKIVGQKSSIIDQKMAKIDIVVSKSKSNLTEMVNSSTKYIQHSLLKIQNRLISNISESLDSMEKQTTKLLTSIKKYDTISKV